MLKPPRSDVPCNGCTACCRGDLIVLHPECGDVVADYDTYKVTNPVTGKMVDALKHTPDNVCIYLGTDGCTIHDRAPAICREFDCRRMFLALDRKTRRLGIAKGLLSRETMAAGRARLHTLERADARAPARR